MCDNYLQHDSEEFAYYSQPYGRSQGDYATGEVWDRIGQAHWQDILDATEIQYDDLNTVDLDSLVTTDDGLTPDILSYQKQYKKYLARVGAARDALPPSDSLASRLKSKVYDAAAVKEGFMHGTQYDYDYNWFNEDDKTEQDNWETWYQRQAAFVSKFSQKSGLYDGDHIDHLVSSKKGDFATGITDSDGHGLAGNLYPGRGVSLADFANHSKRRSRGW